MSIFINVCAEYVCSTKLKIILKESPRFAVIKTYTHIQCILFNDNTTLMPLKSYISACKPCITCTKVVDNHAQLSTTINAFDIHALC